MELETAVVNNVPVLRIDGKIIGEAVLELQQEMRRQLDASGGMLVLDIANVSLMDSSALGTVVATLQSVKQNNGKLVLLNPQKSVRNVLSITRLDTIFEVFTDEADAVASFV